MLQGNCGELEKTHFVHIEHYVASCLLYRIQLLMHEGIFFPLSKTCIFIPAVPSN